MDSHRLLRLSPENGRFERNFDFKKKIGDGATCEVYLAHSTNDMCQYAVKEIPVYLQDNDTTARKVAMHMSSKETLRLARVRGHPNIVQYYSSWFEYIETSQASNLILYIQLELCTKTLCEWMTERDELLKNPNYTPNLEGEHVCRALHHWMKSEKTSADSSIYSPNSGRSKREKQWEFISAESTNSCLEGIVSGLNHLHSKRLAHQDLHGGNILLLVTEAGEVIPKLSDFGGAKTLSIISKSLRERELENGTVIDLRPTEERIQIDPYSYEKASKNDMMSLATIIFDLYHPPASNTQKWDFETISDWESFKKCFEYQARWIEELASDDYDKRPTSVDILRQGQSTVFNSERVKREILEADLLQLRRRNEELQAILDIKSATH
jgi:serine/threonine protein kinase